MTAMNTKEGANNAKLQSRGAWLSRKRRAKRKEENPTETQVTCIELNGIEKRRYAVGQERRCADGIRAEAEEELRLAESAVTSLARNGQNSSK